MSKKLDQAYCDECGDLVSYTTKEEVIEDVNNGVPWAAYLQAKGNKGNE